MEILKPKKLKKGDTFGLLSVSGVVKNTDELLVAKQRLEKSGYNVLVSDTSYTKNRYLCSTKDMILNNLYNFFEDKNINAIICTRGGFGTLKLLNDIDYSIIKNNPKIFVGYSDITNLLAMFYKKAGLIGFHGAMALSDFASDFDKISYYNMLNTLEGDAKSIISKNNITITDGIAKGILWGGNLTSLASMCGIDFLPEEDFIMFVEDWNEPVYKLDRMMTQLLNLNGFKSKLKGIAFGEFNNLDEKEYFDSWINELKNELSVPMSSGFKITHDKEKETIPFGINVTFDSKKGEIIYDEEYLI